MRYMNSQHRDFTKMVLLAEQAHHPKKWRAKFHLMPPVGWLNDPNGLCEFKGEYHIFFQYAPFHASGGSVCWGHYKTSDFITYDSLPPAICPDQSEDCHGVYSGSALIDNDTMYLYYTGNVKKLGEYDYTYHGREHNTILVTSNDGLTFDNKTLIMTHHDDPEDISSHLRDPKVWKDGDMYYMIQGARTRNNIGLILVYRSSDKYHWEQINRLQTPYPFGYMWECPDLFFLDGKTLLCCSPQGLEADGFHYNNLYQSGYFFLDGTFTADYSLSAFTEFDHGFDFYAPQTFEDNQGRRILIGWMGLGSDNTAYTNPTTEDGWQHILTVPRLLTLKENHLYQMPIPELQQLRIDERKFHVYNVFNDVSLHVFEMDLYNNSLHAFTLVIHSCLKLTYTDNTFTMSFIHGGYGRTSRSVHTDAVSALKILCDVSSVEVFLNHGKSVFSTRFYPEENKYGIAVSGDDLDLTLYKLGEFTINKCIY